MNADSAMGNRFVVLHHHIGPGFQRVSDDHFDWMFERGGSLRTWATPVIDDVNDAFTLNCEPLADHRIEYLNYEGPVSGHRGNVTRVVAGTFKVIDEWPSRFLVQVNVELGDLFDKATLVFQRTSLDFDRGFDVSRADWTLSFS
ncbi:hypothetical protein [Rubripirellula reticaptiva]|uniref:DNA ligase D 3'-phosphoesterase domain-containing protein n=1 Tax=Rubripirellula reticaptiva TaxID=2528013 RepID=A0A5C6F9I8_9BACT|nr:hypothetical protein [Rubripirellula reticaptiva]TWU58048.1 hypothetical protein Poly59_09570 [Rubripirellula reticaptiva]